MRISVMRDLSDRSNEGIMLKMTSDLGQMTHKVTREEAMRMTRQLRNVLRAIELATGTPGSSEIIFHEESQEDEIKACRRELSNLRRRLGRMDIRIDTLDRT